LIANLLQLIIHLSWYLPRYAGQDRRKIYKKNYHFNL